MKYLIELYTIKTVSAGINRRLKKNRLPYTTVWLTDWLNDWMTDWLNEWMNVKSVNYGYKYEYAISYPHSNPDRTSVLSGWGWSLLDLTHALRDLGYVNNVNSSWSTLVINLSMIVCAVVYTVINHDDVWLPVMAFNRRN